MVSNVKKHVSADIWGTVVFFIRALYYCITTPLASSVMKSIRYNCVLEKFSRHYSNESLWCWTSTETVIIKKYNSHPLTLNLYFVICLYRCPGSRITDGNVLWFGEGDHHPIVVNDGIQINFSVMHHAEAFLGKMHKVSPSGLLMIISCRQKAAATHRWQSGGEEVMDFFFGENWLWCRSPV